jgi:hypothetical protein
MPTKTEKKKGSLRDRLNAISKRLDRVDSGNAPAKLVEYERIGDRVSVMIRPSGRADRAA